MSRSGYLYAATCEDLVKIGFSHQPWDRLPALTIASPASLTPTRLVGKKAVLVSVTPGTRNSESSIHSALKSHCEQGEWFRIDCMNAPQFKAVFTVGDIHGAGSRKSYRPRICWELWCRIVESAGSAQEHPDEHFQDLLERGLQSSGPDGTRRRGKK